MRGKKYSVTFLSWLFAAVYMVSYMTRINYGAVISEMVSATGFAKSALSMALTGSFITYGAGQIVSGICGDRCSPKKLLCGGLTVTIIMNLLIPLCVSPYQLCAVWCVNGFAQSFMWPPMVRMLSAYATAEEYKSASARMSYGGSLGTIVIYLISPLILSRFGWKAVFYFSAICGCIMLVLWNILLRQLPPLPQREPAVAATGEKSRFFSPLLLVILVAVMLQGMLRDGVTTWMPSYIAETYHWDNAAAILSGCILPIFSAVCLWLASRLYIHKLRNPVSCATVFFLGGLIAALGLYCFTGRNAAVCVVCAALLTGCMHGVNLALICMIPPFYKESGNVSTVSGILNACTYVGSAVSTYAIAVLSQRVGWSNTVLIWMLIALLGTILCCVCARPWQRKWKA